MANPGPRSPPLEPTRITVARVPLARDPSQSEAAMSSNGQCGHVAKNEQQPGVVAATFFEGEHVTEVVAQAEKLLPPRPDGAALASRAPEYPARLLPVHSVPATPGMTPHASVVLGLEERARDLGKSPRNKPSLRLLH